MDGKPPLLRTKNCQGEEGCTKAPTAKFGRAHLCADCLHLYTNGVSVAVIRRVNALNRPI